ncbi:MULTISPECIES: hypothetical protein [Methylotenera]|uniref:hypothetical protein n=1 Tax=Methylotenera TaxID=359407 RepID=UPI000377F8A0|nr:MULTISPECIES: hypothetical protein [Methylotenera]
MKSKSLIGNVLGLAAALLLTTGIAQAGDDKANNVIDQNISKRPYQAPNEPAANKADNWDGATLVKEEAKTGPTNYQQLRIRMLGQRPYMHKSGE